MSDDDDVRLTLWDYIVVLWPFIVGVVVLLVLFFFLIHWAVVEYQHHGLIECRHVEPDLLRCK